MPVGGPCPHPPRPWATKSNSGGRPAAGRPSDILIGLWPRRTTKEPLTRSRHRGGGFSAITGQALTERTRVFSLGPGLIMRAASLIGGAAIAVMWVAGEGRRFRKSRRRPSRALEAHGPRAGGEAFRVPLWLSRLQRGRSQAARTADVGAPCATWRLGQRSKPGVPQHRFCPSGRKAAPSVRAGPRALAC
jgi:hypothetical protein